MRTTAELVGGIVEVDPSITDINPFILIANELVTEKCSDSGYTNDRLELIERWLSAHFYTVRDPRLTAEKAGSVGGNYQSKVDLGFDTSHYGQTAMRLDTAGSLAALNSAVKNGGKRKVGVSYLGTTTPLQEKEYDRT